MRLSILQRRISYHRTNKIVHHHWRYDNISSSQLLPTQLHSFQFRQCQSDNTQTPSIKKKKKNSIIKQKDNELSSNQRKETTTIKALFYKVGERFAAKPPDTIKESDKNLQDRYTTYDKWIDRLVKLRIIEPKGNYKEREKERMKNKGLLQTNLGIEKIGRALSTAENVKRKYGAKKKATKEYIYAEVNKYYKVMGGFITMRHWRVEKWLGIPVKVWIFIYLCIGGIFVVGATHWLSKSVPIEGNKKINTKTDTKHLPFVLKKLGDNERIKQWLGDITEHKLTMLPPADRSNFRARYVHEVWAESEFEGQIRICVIYDTEKSFDGICRIEIHMDDEIIKCDLDETEEGQLKDRSFDGMSVIRCPPDLFPLMHWFTQSRREIFAYIPYYIWPIAPLGCLLALARWHYRSPPGLANYVLDQIQNHIVIRRALGSPIHLQSDQWKGRLTSRSCNMRVLLEGTKHTGNVNVVGYRDGSTRWLFPNVVLMIDGVKHDHYREICMTPFEIVD